jgi:hypothetical protein
VAGWTRSEPLASADRYSVHKNKTSSPFFLLPADPSNNEGRAARQSGCAYALTCQPIALQTARGMNAGQTEHSARGGERKPKGCKLATTGRVNHVREGAWRRIQSARGVEKSRKAAGFAPAGQLITPVRTRGGGAHPPKVHNSMQRACRS